MTPNELKAKHGPTVVRILRRARNLIEDGEVCEFVCIAITIAAQEYCREGVGSHLEEVIGASISPNATVRYWLLDNGHAEDKDTSRENIQDYRLRWIDWMIQGYSK